MSIPMCIAAYIHPEQVPAIQHLSAWGVTANGWICSGVLFLSAVLLMYRMEVEWEGVDWKILGAQLSWFLAQKLVTEGLKYLL